VSYLAAIFEILGAWMVGNRQRHGFLIFMIGNVLWFMLGIKTEEYGLNLVAVVFFMINIRNYRLWRKDGNP